MVNPFKRIRNYLLNNRWYLYLLHLLHIKDILIFKLEEKVNMRTKEEILLKNVYFLDININHKERTRYEVIETIHPNITTLVIDIEESIYRIKIDEVIELTNKGNYIGTVNEYIGIYDTRYIDTTKILERLKKSIPILYQQSLVLRESKISRDRRNYHLSNLLLNESLLVVKELTSFKYLFKGYINGKEKKGRWYRR